MLFHISKNTIIPEVLHKAAAEIAGQAIAAAEEITQPEELDEIQTEGNAPELSKTPAELSESDRAREARRAYHRRYRQEHRAELNEKRRKWARDNPEKIRAQQERYWARQFIQSEQTQRDGEGVTV